MTQKKIFGIIPKVEFNLPDEDSLDGNNYITFKSNLPEGLWDEQIDLIAKAMEESVDIQSILMEVIR